MFRFQTHQIENFNLIYQACEDALTNKKMIAVIAPPGCGKSFGLQYFTRTHQNTHYIELGESVHSKEMFVRILNELQQVDRKRKDSITNILRDIKNELKNRTTNSLIIVDEAGKFNRKRISNFHELRNLTLYKCGIIISGPQNFEEEIIKWVEEELTGVEEFYTRIQYWVRLFRPRNPEIRAVFKNEGLGKEKDEHELLDNILQSSENKRSWRRIEMAIQELFATRKKNKKSSEKTADKTTD